MTNKGRTLFLTSSDTIELLGAFLSRGTLVRQRGMNLIVNVINEFQLCSYAIRIENSQAEYDQGKERRM